jgi:hypothetical protein
MFYLKQADYNPLLTCLRLDILEEINGTIRLEYQPYQPGTRTWSGYNLYPTRA